MVVKTGYAKDMDAGATIMVTPYSYVTARPYSSTDGIRISSPAVAPIPSCQKILMRSAPEWEEVARLARVSHRVCLAEKIMGVGEGCRLTLL